MFPRLDQFFLTSSLLAGDRSDSASLPMGVALFQDTSDMTGHRSASFRRTAPDIAGQGILPCMEKRSAYSDLVRVLVITLQLNITQKVYIFHYSSTHARAQKLTLHCKILRKT